MTRRDGAIIAFLLAVLVVIAGVVAAPSWAPAASPTPAPTPATAYVIRQGIVSRPSSVTPVTARTQADRDLVALIFRGLVRYGPDGSPRADLASSWKSSNKGARWTFTIRSDAAWQDGTPVTSADVVYTIRVLQDEAYEGPLAASWQGVKVTAVNDRVVRFDLEDPLAGFLAAATQPLLPEHLLAAVPIAELATSAFATTTPIGNSAFAISSLTADRAILVPSEQGSAPAPFTTAAPVAPDAAQPYAERIELTFYDTADAAATAYRAGEIDMVDGLPPGEAAQIASIAGSRLIRYPATTLTAVILNVQAGKFSFADKAARRGLLEAIDRNALITDVLSGAGARADSVIPPTSWAFDDEASPELVFDSVEAIKDLVSGGWKRSDAGWTAPKAKDVASSAIELIAPAAEVSPVVNATARKVADAWKEIGLEVTLTELPAADFVDRLRGSDFQAAVVDINVGLDPDLFPLLASAQAIAGGSNVSGFQSVALDTAMTKARQPGTLADRKAAFAQIQKLLAGQLPILPLYFRDVCVVAGRAVSGVEPRIVSDPSQRFSDVITWRVVGR